jgi:chaperone protein EcpD
MTNVLRYAMVGLFLCAGIVAGRSEATVVIGGTRVVYPAQQNEVTVKMTNRGATSSLVQVWLDDGKEETSTPDTAKVPFTTTPPIFRLDPDKGQAVRVMYSGEPLPKDKETLFWVNVLEVPSKSAEHDQNVMQFATLLRIKLFFRPAGLPGEAKSAPEKLTWKSIPGEDGKGMALQVTNPTPYYVSFTGVGLKAGDQLIKQGDNQKGGMVAPGGSTTFPLDEHASRPTGDMKAQFEVIADSGAINTIEQPLTP